MPNTSKAEAKMLPGARLHNSGFTPPPTAKHGLWTPQWENYLILADRATGYIFAHKTDNLSTQGVIQILESIINTFGTPDIIRCDNAGSFRKTFSDWAEKEGIIINHSSPKNSESNRLAEACVQSFKNMIKKNPKLKGQALKRMIFFLNNTPASNPIEGTPSQQYLGLTTKIPIPGSQNLPLTKEDRNKMIEARQDR